VAELLADGLVARERNLLRLSPRADALYPDLRAGMLKPPGGDGLA
jgi:hypothetical protein